MANPFYLATGANAQFGSNNPMNMLAQLQSNPLAMLKRAGFNVPSDVSSPQAIIQHLMNSGQITQQQVNNAQQMARQFGFKR